MLALLRSDVRRFGRVEEIVLVLERLGRFCMNICGDLLAWWISYIYLLVWNYLEEAREITAIHFS